MQAKTSDQKYQSRRYASLSLFSKRKNNLSENQWLRRIAHIRQTRLTVVPSFPSLFKQPLKRKCSVLFICHITNTVNLSIHVKNALVNIQIRHMHIFSGQLHLSGLCEKIYQIRFKRDYLFHSGYLCFLSGIHDQFMSIGISCALYLLHVFPFSKKPSEAFLSLLEQYMKLIPAVEPVLNPISQQTILPACRYWSVLTDFYSLFFTIS